MNNKNRNKIITLKTLLMLSIISMMLVPGGIIPVHAAPGDALSTIKINDSTTNGPILSNGGQFGESVANIGDLNNDGVNDIAVGAQGDDDNGTDRGAVHIIFLDGIQGDTTPPVLSVPADILAEATGTTTVISIGTANATDNIDPTPIITNDSPAAFPLGSTTVTWTATDSSDNSSNATQIITIQDTTPPTISTPDNITTETIGTNSTVSFTLPTADDLVDNTLDISCIPASGTLFSLGNTTVTCTATDDSANTATSTFTVTVIQVAIPVTIDIKPGSDPNCFNNNGNGVIPVAIFGTTSLDANDIDAGTVELEGMAVKVVGKSNKLLAHIEDSDGDGIDDLIVQIEDEDGIFEIGSTNATLTGNLLNGTQIQGIDDICIT